MAECARCALLWLSFVKCLLINNNKKVKNATAVKANAHIQPTTTFVFVCVGTYVCARLRTRARVCTVFIGVRRLSVSHSRSGPSLTNQSVLLCSQLNTRSALCGSCLRWRALASNYLIKLKLFAILQQILLCTYFLVVSFHIHIYIHACCATASKRLTKSA